MNTVVQVASVTLTNAQIKALGTSNAVALVAAPGAGKVLVPLYAVWQCDASAGAYTNISGANSDVEIDWHGGNAAFGLVQETAAGGITKLLGTVSQNIAMCGPAGRQNVAVPATTGGVTPSVATSFANLGFDVNGFNASGAYTGGNAANSLKVTIYYLVLTL